MATHLVCWLAMIAATFDGDAARRLEPVEIVADADGPVRLLDCAAADEIAQMHNPALRAALQEIDAARGRARQAGAWINPEIQYGAMQLGGSDGQYFAQLSQEIVRGGKLRLDRSAACIELRRAELAFVRTRFDVLAAVRRSFFQTLANQRRVAVLEKMETVARKSKETAEKLGKAGVGSPADAVLLEIELERASIAVANARTGLEASKRQLAAVMGRPDLEIGVLAGDLEARLPVFPAIDGHATALSVHSGVQSANLEIEKNRILLQRAQVEPVPNVTVGAGYIRQIAEPNNLAVLQFGMPLPAWNRNEGNIRTARANVDKAGAESSRLQNEITAEWAERYGTYEIARQQYHRLKESVLPRAHRTVELTQRGFEVGQTDFLRVLQAQKSLVETELGLVAALESLWLAAADLAGLTQRESFP